MKMGTRRRLLAGACGGLAVVGVASAALRGSGNGGGDAGKRRLSQYSVPMVRRLGSDIPQP